MALIIKKSSHLYTRVPILFILVGLFAFSPILISIVGANLSEFLTNEPCHEGNCFWGAFGWLFMLTFPLAGLLFIILLIIVIIDAGQLKKK
ncbi:MAG: hypothetical protein ACK4TA_12330 [Saprospiraceae bacterium]